MNSAIDIYLELEALVNMYVRVPCRLGLADPFFASKFFFSKYFESYLRRIIALSIIVTNSSC